MSIFKTRALLSIFSFCSPSLKVVFFGIMTFCIYVLTSQQIIFAQNISPQSNIDLVIDGSKVGLSESIIVSNGRTLLPLRFILNNLGVPNDDKHFIWNDAKKSVDIINDGINIHLSINQNFAIVNNKSIKLDIPLLIYNSRIYIPVRFISELLDCKVAWDSSSRSVIISRLDNYNKNKEVLDNLSDKLTELKTFKLHTFSKYEITSPEEKEFKIVKNINSFKRINITNKEAFASAIINEGFYDKNDFEKKSNSILDMWFNYKKVYSREKPETELYELDLSEEKLSSINKSIFEPFSFINSNDILCTGFKIDDKSSSSLIKMSGNFLPPDLTSFLKEDLSITADMPEPIFKKIKTELFINKISGYPESINIEIGSLDYRKSNLLCSYKFLIQEPGGDFIVSPELNGVKPTLAENLKSADEYYEKKLYGFADESYSYALEFDPLTLPPDALLGKAKCLYYLEYSDKALQYLDIYDKLKPADKDGSLWRARCLGDNGNFSEAIKLCDAVISKNPNYSFAYLSKGIVNKLNGNQEDALKCFDTAIQKNPKEKEAYYFKSNTLFTMEKYQECIDLCSSAKILFPNETEFSKYSATCYENLGNFKKASSLFQEVLKSNPNDENICVSIAVDNFLLKDFDNAELYAKKVLQINPKNVISLEMLERIKFERLPENQRIVSFVKENYLYLNKVEDIDSKLKILQEKKDFTSLDVEKFINSVKQTNDIFTYVVSGSNYLDLLKSQSENKIITSTRDSSTYQVKINMFTNDTDKEFKSFVNSIKEPERKNLIIDLRNNPGGVLYSTNKILDILLPTCVSSVIIDREGNSEPNYSDNSQIKFKKIIVLVNQNSASSSELLALSLKKYLNNVTIVGSSTVGKGVGQKIYESKEKQFMIFLVSFYWNVREENISKSSITPDIWITGDKETDYDAVIKDILSK